MRDHDPVHLALEPWCGAVRDATDAVGFIELPSTRLIEVSPSARELLGPNTNFGIEVLVPDERAEASAIIKGATAGVIDGTEARRQRWRRADGSVYEVTVRARVVRLGGAAFGVWIVRELTLTEDDSTSGTSHDAIEWPAGERSQPWVTATLDDQWRVRQLTGDLEWLRDVLSEGTVVTAVTHPDDMARLVFAFAGATTTVDDVAARVRLVSDRELIEVDITVRRLDDGSWRLAFAPVRGRAAPDPRTSRRLHDLEASLRRIAGELHGAGIGSGPAAAADVLRIPGVSQLPDRQREIVVRLARGERVGTIAARMYLSANTVRNHLSTVFRKFGVHSQQELLVLLLEHEAGEGDEAPSSP